MEFSVNPAAGLPIYQQIAEQIRAAIARGRLRPDQRLPSVRDLSQQLVVNPNTIARAYTELEREGVLYSRQGMGVFVAQAGPAVPKKVRRERLLASLDRLLVEAVRLGATSDELTELVAERVKQYQWVEPARAS
jgi:GntR family transcriptional regulator